MCQSNLSPYYLTITTIPKIRRARVHMAAVDFTAFKTKTPPIR